MAYEIKRLGRISYKLGTCGIFLALFGFVLGLIFLKSFNIILAFNIISSILGIISIIIGRIGLKKEKLRYEEIGLNIEEKNFLCELGVMLGMLTLFTIILILIVSLLRFL